MITAGPTREALDQYVSSAITAPAKWASPLPAPPPPAAGDAIAGPVSLPTPPSVTRVDVTSALEMEQAVQQRAAQQQIFISCAAVADYRPERIADEKIKTG